MSTQWAETLTKRIACVCWVLRSTTKWIQWEVKIGHKHSFWWSASDICSFSKKTTKQNNEACYKCCVVSNFFFLGGGINLRKTPRTSLLTATPSPGQKRNRPSRDPRQERYVICVCEMEFLILTKMTLWTF